MENDNMNYNYNETGKNKDSGIPNIWNGQAFVLRVFI